MINHVEGRGNVRKSQKGVMRFIDSRIDVREK